MGWNDQTDDGSEFFQNWRILGFRQISGYVYGDKNEQLQ